jgi:8-oxo-dGTP diphosphatase
MIKTKLDRPAVGLGLLLVKKDPIRGDLILLGKRKGSHWEGEFGGPGGHLRPGESLYGCILRELGEEAGSALRVKKLKVLCITNLADREPHYLDIGLVAEWESGEPMIMEPDKTEAWGWFPLEQLPSPLMSGMANYIRAYKLGETCLFEGSGAIFL